MHAALSVCMLSILNILNRSPEMSRLRTTAKRRSGPYLWKEALLGDGNINYLKSSAPSFSRNIHNHLEHSGLEGTGEISNPFPMYPCRNPRALNTGCLKQPLWLNRLMQLGGSLELITSVQRRWTTFNSGRESLLQAYKGPQIRFLTTSSGTHYNPVTPAGKHSDTFPWVNRPELCPYCDPLQVF